MSQSHLDCLGALARHRGQGNGRARVTLSTVGLGALMLVARDACAFLDECPEARILCIQPRGYVFWRNACRVFTEVIPGISANTYYASQGLPVDQVVVTSLPQLIQGLDELAPDTFDYITVHKAFQTDLEQLRQALNHFIPKFFLCMEDRYGEDSQLLDDSFELPIVYVFPGLSEVAQPAQLPDMSDEKLGGFYNSRDTGPEENAARIRAMRGAVDDLLLVVYCHSIDDGRQLMKFLPEARLLDRPMPPVQQQELLAEFEAGRVPILVALYGSSLDQLMTPGTMLYILPKEEDPTPQPL